MLGRRNNHLEPLAGPVIVAGIRSGTPTLRGVPVKMRKHSALLEAAIVPSGLSYHGPNMMAGMFRAPAFFGLITSAFAGKSLDPLLHASRGFSIAIQQQLAAIHTDPSSGELAEKTIDYAEAVCGELMAGRVEWKL